MLFKYKAFAPPGGRWFYTVPETGLLISNTSSMRGLIRDVTRHCITNNITVPADLEERIEHYMCVNLPTGFCVGEDPRPGSELPLTFYEAVNKMEQFFRGSKFEYVEYRLAEERGLTCKKCPMNSLAMCTSCNGLRAAASRYVGRRKLRFDDFLGLCRVLRLPINALVHIQVRGVVENSTLPDSCWVITEAKAEEDRRKRNHESEKSE